MAKARVSAELTERFSILFSVQMKRLLERNCPKNVVEALAKKKEEVISEAIEVEIAEDHIIFVPVVPRTEVGLGELMRMVREGSVMGKSTLIHSDIKGDMVAVPQEPYFMLDIEDGRSMLNKSPEEAETLIDNQDRSGFTAEEGIALCIHTKVLSDHFVNCVGSRCGIPGSVPSIYCKSKLPVLDWSSSEFVNVKWGSASCSIRV